MCSSDLEVSDGRLVIRVSDEHDQNGVQSEAVITASGPDMPLFSRAWWYYTRTTNMGTVVLLDKHYWLQVGVSEILYKRGEGKRHVG